MLRLLPARRQDAGDAHALMDARAARAAHDQLPAAAPTSDGGPQTTQQDVVAAGAERRAARNKAARNRKQRRIASALRERQLQIMKLESQLERARDGRVLPAAALGRDQSGSTVERPVRLRVRRHARRDGALARSGACDGRRGDLTGDAPAA